MHREREKERKKERERKRKREMGGGKGRDKNKLLHSNRKQFFVQETIKIILFWHTWSILEILTPETGNY